ncbi:hypothetical protein C2845_PM15G18290 [Panicum miliaceum]|uniref:Disease resistance R13L4/SHOC-2-like LRR domain-containing protein n=1 Tax=Panicum miliaceum TaxID=4540 RepID=A0A3L6QB96_PANMI|nr:hypothetical protein C2845_PM15G18290 [Panicum miliaceum]
MDYVDKELVQAVILQVKNLKYLEISRQYGEEALPEAISDIWSLQALHLTPSDLLELLKFIGKLQKLRMLNLSHCEKLKCSPDSIVDCQMISSIDLCNCKQLTVLPSSIGRNKMLRVLRLGNTKMERLPSSITSLRNLECLDLHECRELVELPKDIGNLEKLHVLNLTKCEKLGGVPVGIGQLSWLQKLGLFALGEGEKFAGISELANLPRIGGELSIRGIGPTVERIMPDEKEGGGCSNSTPHVGQVRVGSCLSNLDIVKCPRLKVKPYLPSSLHKLLLAGRTEQLLQSSNFSQLKKLVVWGNGGLGSGRGWELLQPMTALESLEIQHSSGLIELPESLGNLKSLRSLQVFACSAIRMLPMSLGDLPSLQELTITICHCFVSFPQSIGRLTSLQVLKILLCDALQQLPECLGDLRSLRKLYLSGLPRLTCIPQFICHLTSLKELKIGRCPGIKSLPEGVKGLTTLQELDIRGCPDLARHCKRGKEYWSYVLYLTSLCLAFSDGKKQFQATYGNPLLAARDSKSSPKGAEAGILAMVVLISRAHRLGQRKVANVHCLIMCGALEEKVMSLQRFEASVLPRDSSDDPSKDFKRKSGGQGFKSILSGLGEL